MVLVVLAIIWGVLLVSWLRSRTGGTFSDSVGTFRRHLSVLERTAPVTVAPANRLRSGPVGDRQPLYRQPLYRQPVRQLPPYRVGYGTRPGGVAVGHGARPGSGLRPPSPAAIRRRQAQKRRRDVFFTLLAAVVGTFLVALIPGLSVMWGVQVTADILFLGYVALLVRMRNLAAERELKLTFVPPPARVPRARPGYDLGRDYSDLSLRRAAN